MPKKTAPVQDAAAAEEELIEKESRRRFDAALRRGVVRRQSQQPAQRVPPSKGIEKSNNIDIIKKGTLRKNKYLFVLPALIAPAAAGTMGSLAELDTRTPVLYVDFPEGRLKFFGSIVHSSNKLLTFAFGAKSIQCEDCFDTAVVFSEAWWIGTKASNPEEKQLPMPAHMAVAAAGAHALHSDVSYIAGAGAGEAGVVKAAPKGAAAVRAVVQEVEAAGRASALAGEGDDEDGEEDLVAPSQASSRRGQRTAAQGRKRYADDDKSSGSEGSSDDEPKDAKLKRARRPAPAARPPAPDPDPVVDLTASPAPKASQKQNKPPPKAKARAAAPRRQSTQSRKRARDDSDDDDDGDEEEEETLEMTQKSRQSDDSKRPAQSSRPRRQSTQSTRSNPFVLSSDDDDDGRKSSPISDEDEDGEEDEDEEEAEDSDEDWE